MPTRRIEVPKPPPFNRGAYHVLLAHDRIVRDALYDIGEVASLLRIPTATLKRKIKAGAGPVLTRIEPNGPDFVRGLHIVMFLDEHVVMPAVEVSQ